jgi:hypothetical protein
MSEFGTKGGGITHVLSDDGHARDGPGADVTVPEIARGSTSLGFVVRMNFLRGFGSAAGKKGTGDTRKGNEVGYYRWIRYR